jgi:hypothetical protein
MFVFYFIFTKFNFINIINKLLKGTLIGTDSSLFYQNQAFKRFKRQATSSSSYRPTFLQSIINKNPSLAQQANLTCNYNAQCVSAYLTSGLADIGQQTRSSIQANQNLITAIGIYN